MNILTFPRSIAVAVGCALGFFSAAIHAFADVVPCATCAPCVTDLCVSDDAPPSWIFRHSTYSHDPETGARVAQYMRTPPVEPLEDERNVTSRYRRSRTNIRGADGSIDTYYEVQAWGNGRGGIDAEWERFHDAWKESYLQNGYYNQGPGFNNGHPGQWGNGNGFYGNQWNNNFPGNGFPGGWNGGQGNWGPNNGPPNGGWNGSWNGGPGFGGH